MLVKDSACLEKFQKEIEVMVISFVLQSLETYYSPLKSVLTTHYFEQKRLTGHKNIVEYFASQITEIEESSNPYKYEVLILMEYSAGSYLA